MYISLVIKICISVSFFLSYSEVTNACGRGSISIENNGYRNILIAIADGVDEDPNLIEKIKEVFTQASALLYKATRQRSFFEQITILVPGSWQGDYAAAGGETFDKSDIVVESSFKTDQPFVIKTTPCGEYGYYMRLTTAYLMDETVAEMFGPYDKVIVHEWSHLRFGVFDEYPMEFSRNHFYAGQGGDIEATRCNTQLEGRMINPKTGRECEYEGNFPEEDCRFQDYILDGDGYSSLMYKTFLDHVTEFCDNDADYPKLFHNREAPTLQNKMCGGSSIWEVLRDHPDFKGINPPREINDTTPIFKVVKPLSLRTVLVLDTSGSMDGCKIDILGQGCSNYISNIIQDGEELGIVWFNAVAEKKRVLTMVNDNTRQEMLADIPTVANGGTSIGSGINAALELLEAHNPDEDGGFLIVVSDGEETDAPYVADVADDVIAAKVTVHSIAITNAADSAVDKLSLATGGLSFIFSDCSSSNAINEAFLAIGELNTSPTNRSYVLTSEVHTISNTIPLEGSTLIDNTLGRNTQFIFDYDVSDIDPVVTSPNGTVYDKTDTNIVTHDSQFRIYRFTIPQQQFESGTWHYKVTTTAASVRVAVTVKSQSATDGEYPILATVSWGQRSIPVIGPGNENPKQPVYASVSQGYSPVLNADVGVEVVKPGGDSFTLNLFDNGAGTDAVAGDGIYSSYFTYFDADGRYGIQVIVNSNPATMVSSERIIGGGVMKQASSDKLTDIPVDPFTRSASGGSFELESYSSPGAHGKFYPPGQITDLKVESASFVNQTAVLTWTAAGAQLDQGIANLYDLRIGTDFTKMETEFLNQTQVTDDMIVSNTTLSSPQPAGLTERFVIYMPSKGDITYVFAIVAVDLEGRVVMGPVSNIASVSMKDFHANETPDKFTAGEIVGITIGVLAVIAILIVTITLISRNTGSGESDEYLSENNKRNYQVNKTDSSSFSNFSYDGKGV